MPQSTDSPGNQRAQALEDRPRRLSAAGLLAAIPGLAQQFRPVPRSYTRHEGERMIVRCPCGRRPVLRRGELVSCERAHCWLPGVRTDCPRFFIFANTCVLVTGSPA